MAIKKGLLIVDEQLDFLPINQSLGIPKMGSFAVPEGDTVILPTESYILSGEYAAIAITEDTHPPDHESFHFGWLWELFSGGKPKPKDIGRRVHYEMETEAPPAPPAPPISLKEKKDIRSGNEALVGIYPPHCVIGTQGQRTHPKIMNALIRMKYPYMVLSKGTQHEHLSCIHVHDLRNHIVNTLFRPNMKNREGKVSDKDNYIGGFDPANPTHAELAKLFELNDRLIEPMGLDHDGLQNRIKIQHLFADCEIIDVVGLSLNHCVVSNALSIEKLAQEGVLPKLRAIRFPPNGSKGVRSAVLETDPFWKDFKPAMHSEFAVGACKQIWDFYEKQNGIPSGIPPIIRISSNYIFPPVGDINPIGTTGVGVSAAPGVIYGPYNTPVDANFVIKKGLEKKAPSNAQEQAEKQAITKMTPKYKVQLTIEERDPDPYS